MLKIPHDPNEILAVVDENDEIIGEAQRGYIHKDGLLHREVYVYLIAYGKSVLLQKRTDNSLWNHSSSGHFPLHQGYLEAAVRECEEELGISINTKEFEEIAYKKYEAVKPNGEINNCFGKTYLVRKDIPLERFRADVSEVQAIGYFSKSELLHIMGLKEDIVTPCCKTNLEDYILRLLG